MCGDRTGKTRTYIKTPPLNPRKENADRQQIRAPAGTDVLFYKVPVHGRQLFHHLVGDYRVGEEQAPGFFWTYSRVRGLERIRMLVSSTLAIRVSST